MFERNRSKNVELLARCWDHAKNRSYKGFRMLTLGWSDGYTFIPVDFSLLSSLKAQINGIKDKIDKRTSGYKRRIESLKSAPELVPHMIDRALSAGITASYVLMDSWFTHAPLIQDILDRGLDVIGMVKKSKQPLGGLFMQLCDEVSELDWAIALQQLFQLINDLANKTNKKISKMIKSQLQQWIAGLPNYIKAYLPISCCES